MSKSEDEIRVQTISSLFDLVIGVCGLALCCYLLWTPSHPITTHEIVTLAVWGVFRSSKK